MRYVALTLRWAGRITAVAFAAMLAAFVLGEGPPVPASELAFALTALLFIAVAANVLGWLWPIFAACVSLGSGLAFIGLTLRDGGLLPGPWVLAMLLLPGLLHVAGMVAHRGTRW